MIDFNNPYTCMSCNIHSVNRRCDLMRHIKKCDDTISTFNEYLIKYHLNYDMTCENIDCDSDKEILKTKISLVCRTCRLDTLTKKISMVRDNKKLNDPLYNKKIQDKRKKTTYDKYGVDHIIKVKEIREKVKSTNIKRYGESHTLALSHVKNAREHVLTEDAVNINKKRKQWWLTEANKGDINAKRELTLLQKYNVKHVSQIPGVNTKISLSVIDRYKDPSYILKCKQLLINKYGVDSVMKLQHVCDKVRKTNELRNNWLPLEMANDYSDYRKVCDAITRKHIKTLFSNWNGRCYYTNEILLDNKSRSNEPMYRSIDHMISVFSGFMESIDPMDIGDINNLCICSRSVNSKKGKQNIGEFLNGF